MTELNLRTPARPAVRPTFGKNAWSVLAVFVAIVLIGMLVLAYLVSESGIIRVPFFSRFYRGPQPTRTIEAAPIDVDAFRVLLSSRVLSQASAGVKPPYTISVTEKELTGALRGSIGAAFSAEGWEVERPQLVVTPTEIEFSGRMRHGVFSADLLMRFSAVVENGGLTFVPHEIQLGDDPIHPNLAKRLASALFSRDFGTWTITFGEARLESVELRDGTLELTAGPANL